MRLLKCVFLALILLTLVKILKYTQSYFVFILIKNNENDTSNLEVFLKHITIHSALYYNVSKLYLPHTMTVLFNAHTDYLNYNVTLQCFSQNKTTNLTTPANVRTGDSSGPFCLWRSYFLTCPTVENPYYFGLTTIDSQSVIELEFEYPVQKKYPVIMCYPQMFYESRWQQIIFATEIYNYFGADLQIQYINSAMTEIVEILKIYQKKGWVKIQPFGYVDFDTDLIESIGYHPMHELNARNQALAYTDCLMRYRESSEFVIVGDIDEIFIPKKNTYFDEFYQWKEAFPKASAFMYYRADAKFKQTYSNFSLYDTISSVMISSYTYVGKSVYQTKYAEMAWIHWPGYDNITTATIPSSNNTIYHISPLNAKDYKEMSKYYNARVAFSPMQISKIAQNFSLLFQQHLPKYPSNKIYAKIIKRCFNGNSAYQNPLRSNQKEICINPFQCKLPKTVRNYKCIVARRQYTKHLLKKDVALHIPSGKSKFYESNNGCNVFLN